MINNEIDLINYALRQLSIDPIGSIDEQSKEAKIMKDTFQLSKECILRDYVFDWAHKAEKLVRYADADAGYQQPADCIKVIGLGTDCQYCCCSSDFKNLVAYTHRFSIRKVNGRLYIETCCPGYDILHFIYNNQNYNDMPSDLFELMCTKLASDTAFFLTGNLSLAQYLEAKVLRLLSEVRRHEGAERKPVRGCTYEYPFGKPWQW